MLSTVAVQLECRENQNAPCTRRFQSWSVPCIHTPALTRRQHNKLYQYLTQHNKLYQYPTRHVCCLGNLQWSRKLQQLHHCIVTTSIKFQQLFFGGSSFQWVCGVNQEPDHAGQRTSIPVRGLTDIIIMA